MRGGRNVRWGARCRRRRSRRERNDLDVGYKIQIRIIRMEKMGMEKQDIVSKRGQILNHKRDYKCGGLIKKQMATNSPIQNAEQKKSPTHLHPPTPSITDIEFLINANLMHNISSKLLDRELSLIVRSNTLIDEFANFNTKQMQTTKDSLTTKESKSEIRVKSSRFERDRRVQVRKNNHNFSVSRQYEQILKQIKAKCSLKTYQAVDALIHHKNMPSSTQHNFDQLTSKLKTKQQTIRLLIHENDRLARQSQFSAEKETLLKEMNRIKEYVEEKERGMRVKWEQVSKVEERIAGVIVREGGEGCSECMRMRKIKEGIVEFRRYLSEESKFMDNLFVHYKQSIFAKC